MLHDKKLWFTLKVINRILCKVGDLISCIFFGRMYFNYLTDLYYVSFASI